MIDSIADHAIGLPPAATVLAALEGLRVGGDVARRVGGWEDCPRRPLRLPGPPPRTHTRPPPCHLLR